MRRLDLRRNTRHSSVNARFKQIRNFDSSKLQLPTTNAYCHVLIKRRTKVNELQVLLITEESLGRLVEPFGDVVYRLGCTIFRVL